MPKKALIVFDLSPVKMIDTKKIKINKKIKIFDSLLSFNFDNKQPDIKKANPFK